MNVRMTATQEIRLPDEVVDALGIDPGAELQITRRPHGEFVLEKAAATAADRPSREEMRQRLLAVTGAARRLAL